MEFKKLSVVMILAATTCASGCAAYRTDSSNVSFDSTDVGKRAATVLITEDALPGRKYRELGAVEGEVKKLTVFHKDPTKEQVNIVLSEKAKQIGADAVINVKYEGGIGLTTWGYLTGKGTGVKLDQ